MTGEGPGEGQINAFAYWTQLQQSAAARPAPVDAAAERERWRSLAHDYNRNALHVSAPEFVTSIVSLIEPGASVLEIGPGTGGFTIPAAARAGRVFAVDMSDAMLAVLQGELRRREIGNVTAVQAEWPDVEAGRHDVVLAVNSLYRVVDLRACIERMTAAARRRVVVAWSVGHNPPVLPSVVDPRGPRGYRPGVTYIHLLLALHELGIATEVDVRRVQRQVWRASYEDAAEKLIGLPDPTEQERGDADALARRLFVPHGDGVVYSYEGQVAVICWPGAGDE
ncbi:MAG: class I SAM-dependent methyltransferase [Dehalococcoidia bacterium]